MLRNTWVTRENLVIVFGYLYQLEHGWATSSSPEGHQQLKNSRLTLVKRAPVAGYVGKRHGALVSQLYARLRRGTSCVRQPPSWRMFRRNGSPSPLQKPQPPRWAPDVVIPETIRISTAEETLDVIGLYLINFVAHDDLDNWSASVSLYFCKPAHKLLKRLTT